MESTEYKDDHASTGDYLVGGTDAGEELLKKMKTFHSDKRDEVIYGVYNNEGKGITVKLNDFLIDRGKVGLKDKSYFFHMLAVMVDSGIPLLKSMSSIAGRVKSPRLSRVLNTMVYDCERGSNLADAMSRFEDVFDEAEIGIVRSGEATGRLHQMLFKLSEQLEKRYKLYAKLWGAAVYPIAVLVVLFVVSLGMLVWVLPSLLGLLDHSGIAREALPSSTRALIFLQSFTVGYWWLILLVLLGLYGLFTMYKNTPNGAAKWDYWKLNLPVAGDLSRKFYVQRFVGMMGILIDSGLPVMKALAIAGNSISNRMYRLKIQEVINEVRGGRKISESLKDSEFLFPSEVVQMLQVGERSASLGSVSRKVADQYEMEIDNSLKRITSIFEPVLIVIVGLLVGFLAMSIMAPIFNLSNVIS